MTCMHKRLHVRSRRLVKTPYLSQLLSRLQQLIAFRLTQTRSYDLTFLLPQLKSETQITMQ